MAVAFMAFGACKKSKKVEPEASRADLTRDSIFLYAKEVYLWNSSLPSYEMFNPRKYNTQSKPLDNYDQELFDITKYSTPYEYTAGATSPKFSYISDKADQNPTAALKSVSVDTEGNGYDVGIRLQPFGVNSNYILYVAAVYQNSPAEAAGFKRGDLITKINGVTYGTNFSTQSAAIFDALDAASVTLEGLRGNGSSFNVNLVKKSFTSSPIYSAKTITAGSQKIGYLAYARFSNTKNSWDALDAVFSNFANTGVTDLVIDLRYNGGGYVHTAARLINLIAPSTANNKVMFTEHYNTQMQRKEAKILANQPATDADGKIIYQNGKMRTYADEDYSVAGNTYYVAKVGSLMNIRNVVFIISRYSASASELVINSLKPYMTVTTVGERSYGKPVGFFPITIENKYEVFFSMFETKNAQGVGGYYNGFTPDYAEASELAAGNVLYDFGNVNEPYLKRAIAVLAPGSTATGEARLSTSMMSVMEKKNLPANAAIGHVDQGGEFFGMIENRFGKRNK